ncbi:MAG: hypothetical protein ACSHX9_17555 [Luteolibacter sp.]
MRLSLKLLLVSLLVLGVSCGKKKTTSLVNEEEVVTAKMIDKQQVVADLGFASRVPADSDFYFAAHYNEEEWLDGVMDWGLEMGLLLEGKIEGYDEAEARQEIQDTFGGYFGSEIFVFSGPGVGDKLTMVGESYRQLSAAWSGFAIGALLDALSDEEKEPDFSELVEGFSDYFLDRWLAVIQEDSKLLIPSVVVGWDPASEQRDECVKAISGFLDSTFMDEEGVGAVSFESHGALMAGYEVEGAVVFGEMIEEMRKGMEETLDDMDYGSALSERQLQQLLEALEGVKFTVAAGVVDGRVLIYFGDGEGGFKLSEIPETSLAGVEGMRWLAPSDGKRLAAVGYFSEEMVGTVLPWLDDSLYWEAIGKAVRAPIVEQRTLRELLMGLGSNARELAQRDISAWSAALFTGESWSLSTRGGIVDPSIDFETPLGMREAVSGMNPAFYGHWIQTRDWNDLSWKRLEYMGFILQTVASEFVREKEPEEAILDNTAVVMKVGDIVQGLNSAYREEFRNGIGDEVAVFGDFLGEMPPVPGISEETVQKLTVPRFVYARPVIDRAMLSKAGESSVKIWAETVEYVNGFADDMVPLIEPQMIESGGLQTWFAPLPFIGGDFVPGVSLNDSVWMMGTSRELAGGLSKGMEEKSVSGETGVIVELDFDALEMWVRQVYEEGKDDAEAMAQSELGAAEIEQVEKAAGGFMDGLKKLKSLKYRHWLESGVPQTRLDISFGEE